MRTKERGSDERNADTCSLASEPAAGIRNGPQPRLISSCKGMGPNYLQISPGTCSVTYGTYPVPQHGDTPSLMLPRLHAGLNYVLRFLCWSSVPWCLPARLHLQRYVSLRGHKGEAFIDHLCPSVSVREGSGRSEHRGKAIQSTRWEGSHLQARRGRKPTLMTPGSQTCSPQSHRKAMSAG